MIRTALHYLRLSHAQPDQWRRFGETLPASMRSRIDLYRRVQDREARIAGRWLLGQSLKAMTGGCHAPERRAWSYDDLMQDQFGRPFLRGWQGIDFNLSHSGDVVVCVVSSECRVGVDVERIREINPSGFESVFAPSTWKALQGEGDKVGAFFRTWTRVESVAKAEGFGIAGPVNEIEFDGHLARIQDRTWFLKEVELGAEYACHIATGSDCLELTVQEHD